MRKTFAILTAIAALLPSPGFCSETNVQNSLVQIIVTFQDSDPFMPWQKLRPGMRVGYGIAVSNGTVITTESLLRNHTLVELRTPRSGDKIPATVEIADIELDLALVTFDDESKTRIVKPVELAAKPVTKAPLTIIQMDETSQVQEGEAKPVNMTVGELPNAPYPVLLQSVLTDLNVNGEGAGMIADGKLAGIVLMYDSRTRIANVLPVSAIRRFLADAATPPYKGSAFGGFSWASLVDPAKRRFLNVQTPGKGVMVLACYPGTGASEVLRPNDVILALDNHEIDSMGYYDDPELGRLTLPYLLKGLHKPGDVIPVRIVREKKESSVQLKLTRNEDDALLIPEDILGRRNDYVVSGGMIIRELTGRYLRAHGGDWQKNVDPRLTHYYAMSGTTPSKRGEHIVILSSVLPDAINVGYEHLRDQVVTSVNGKPVNSMDDVFSIVESDNGVRTIKLLSMGVELVLDQRELGVADERLGKQYRLTGPKWRKRTE